MKKFLATASALMISVSVYSDVNWYAYPAVASGFGLWDEGGVGTGNLLTGHDTDNTVGFFVQLMQDVAQNGADLAVASGNGENPAGDDIVVDTAWVGKDTSFALPSGPADGWFEFQTYPLSGSPGTLSSYYLRAWNAPSPNFALGSIPVSPGTYYGNSNIIFADAGTPKSIDFTRVDEGGGQGASNGISTDTALIAVPEPTTLTLMLGGICAIWLKRRRRS